MALVPAPMLAAGIVTETRLMVELLPGVPPELKLPPVMVPAPTCKNNDLVPAVMVTTKAWAPTHANALPDNVTMRSIGNTLLRVGRRSFDGVRISVTLR